MKYLLSAKSLKPRVKKAALSAPTKKLVLCRKAYRTENAYLNIIWTAFRKRCMVNIVFTIDYTISTFKKTRGAFM